MIVHTHPAMPLRSDLVSTPEAPSTSPPLDVSPVANPDKHAPVSCSLLPYDAYDSPLIPCGSEFLSDLTLLAPTDSHNPHQANQPHLPSKQHT